MIGRIEASLEWGVTAVVAIGGTVFYQSYWFVLIERLKIEFYSGFQSCGGLNISTVCHVSFEFGSL